MKRALSFDIGSTWTKGALVDLGAHPRCRAWSAAATTVDDLTRGVFAVLAQLSGMRDDRPIEGFPPDVPLYFSSSAKGGLAIAAVGIVPDLTLQAARLVAASAGGKIVAHFAYHLAPQHMAQLEHLCPDIILLSGGTDGGNEQYNLHNARVLAQSQLSAIVLYAGNISVQSQVREILADKPLAVVDNLMPEIGRLCVEPARRCIQELFLQRMVEGRGLAALADHCAADPKPTPRAVFDLLAAIADTIPHWEDTLLFDLGGATTDVYSYSDSFQAQPGYVLRGLREPRLKRTVEGDLGLRVNARCAADTARDYVERELATRRVSCEQFAQHVEAVSATPDYLPRCAADKACDEILAGACLYHSLLRHAGTVEESYTPDGKVYVQRGKDLRKVRRLIGSGGYLARQRSADLQRAVLAAVSRDTGGTRLVPESIHCYCDADYLWPLLGNLAADYPIQAVQLAVEHLVQIDEGAPAGLPAEQCLWPQP